MSITVPTAGTSITAAWGAAVANKLNLVFVSNTARTTASGSFGDLTDWSFACVNGVNYSITIQIWYSHSSTSGGPVVGFNHPGGEARLNLVYRGETSGVSETTEYQNSTDAGGATGVATVASADTPYLIEGYAYYQCTADGTFALRFKRNTTGTLTIKKGSLLMVVADTDA